MTLVAIKYAIVRNDKPDNYMPAKLYDSEKLALSANNKAAFPRDLSDCSVRVYHVTFVEKQGENHD